MEGLPLVIAHSFDKLSPALRFFVASLLQNDNLYERGRSNVALDKGSPVLNKNFPLLFREGGNIFSTE